MKDFTVLYVPIGVGTFHMPTAEQEYQESCDLLRRLAEEAGLPETAVRIPEGILFSSDAVETFLAAQPEPALVILQNVTFANAAYTAKICEAMSAPVLVWTLRDPAGDGGRLRLNALTGAFASAHTLYMNGEISYRHLLGNPVEENIETILRAYLKALEVRKRMDGRTVLSVGEPPEGFSFGTADPEALQKSFGLRLEQLGMKDMFALADAVTDEEAAPYLAEAAEQLPGFTAIPHENRRGHAALLCAYRKYAAEHDVAALSSRCWPDCFTEYGTPVCTALSMLGDLGIPAACEGDTYGAVTMLLGAWLSGQAVFFGDPAQLNEEDNTITFWHCGMAAPSLAFEEEGPAVGVHCNRGIGPTMEFGCKGSSRATILRIGKEKDGSLRLFLCAGEAIGRPRQYHGTSLVVKPDRPAGELIRWAVEDGWEPHFVIAYGDITQEVRALAAMCGIGLWMY